MNVISDSYIDQFSELLRNDKFKGKKMKGSDLRRGLELHQLQELCSPK